MIEVRGVGIVRVAPSLPAEISLLVDLVPAPEIERLPEENQTRTLLGRTFPLLKLSPFEASAAVKLMLALAGARDPEASL